MSLQIRNGISAELARRAARIRDRRPVLEAMGAEFVSQSKRAFANTALRPAPWAPKKDGTPATLRKSGALFQSIRVVEVTNDSVTSGSDRPYAAIHQLGGRTGRNHAATMPPRPYFPILNGKLTPEAQRRIEAVGKAKIDSLLR
jgi:phage virion morphogenesis protein